MTLLRFFARLIAIWRGKIIPRLGAILLTLIASEGAIGQVNAEVCGDLKNAIGPFDYRTERGTPLQLVESAHFTPPIEAALRGNTGHIGGDLDYTLRAFPNHHRALVSAAKYAERMKSPQPTGFHRPIECYFERAVRWRADDVVVRMLYAQYLYKHSRGDEARLQMRRAADGADSALTHSNLALVYIEGKDFQLALTHAHKAQELGLVRPEIRDRLRSVGQWREPEAAPVAKPLVQPASSP